MIEGEGKSLYERPYRWALEAAGDSHFVAVVFPILVHSAFGTPQPVRVFCQAFARALGSETLDGAPATGNINFDWLNSWDAVLGEAFGPTIADLSLPAYTSGFDVIKRGPLDDHPVYSEVTRHQQAVLLGHAKRNYAAAPDPRSGSLEAVELHATADLGYRQPLAIFGLPGQPTYRFMLGMTFRPSVVNFADGKLHCGRPGIALKKAMMIDDPNEPDTFEEVVEALTPRIARFRNAQWAQARGLALDAFEPDTG
jgi:hypothetical protein